MALDATVGGSASNSYVTVAVADAYFGTRLHCSDWTDATTSDKEKALIQATRILDEYCTWLGIKTDTTAPQALEWPRIGICYDGGAIYYEYDVSFYEYDTFSDGYWILDSDTIPQQILDGTCELALVLLGRDTQSDATLSSLNIAGLKMDLAKSNRGYEIIPPYVWQILSPLGQLRGSSGTIKLLRC